MSPSDRSSGVPLPRSLSLFTRRQTLQLDVTGAFCSAGQESAELFTEQKQRGKGLYTQKGEHRYKLVCTQSARILLMRTFDLQPKGLLSCGYVIGNQSQHEIWKILGQY